MNTEWNKSLKTSYFSYLVMSILCFFICSVSVARDADSEIIANTGLMDSEFSEWEIVKNQEQLKFSDQTQEIAPTEVAPSEIEALITSEPRETLRINEPQSSADLSNILDDEQQYLSRKKILDLARLSILAYSIAKEGSNFERIGLKRSSFSVPEETPWQVISFRGSKGSTVIDTAKNTINAASTLTGNSAPLPDTPLACDSTVGIAALRKKTQTLPHALQSYELVIALNGTMTAADALTDSWFNKDDQLTPLGLNVDANGHSGFVAAAKSAIPSMESAIKQLFIDAELFKTQDINNDLSNLIADLEKRNIHIDTVFTGHSLGGGLALPLAAYYASNTLLGTAALSIDGSDFISAYSYPERLEKGFPIYVVTFGAPRVFDYSGAAEIENLIGRGHILRVVNDLDIVARIPLAAMNFAHPGLTLWIPTEINLSQYSNTIFTEAARTAVMFAAAMSDPTWAAGYALCIALLKNASIFIKNCHSMNNYLKFAQYTLPTFDLNNSNSASELDSLLLPGNAPAIYAANEAENKTFEPTLPLHETGSTVSRDLIIVNQTTNKKVHKSTFSYLTEKISYLAEKAKSFLKRLNPFNLNSAVEFHK